MPRTRVAILGAGYWGSNHVRTFAGQPRAQLVAVCDPSRRALERAALVAAGARLTENLDDVLDGDAVDAVVIATPAASHVELACRALARGLHVLVEKPLALDVAGAERVVEAARQSGTVAMVGHLMLYHPVVEYLRRLITGGELGKTYYLSSVRANLGRLRHDENALWSFAPHDFSMIDYLLDEPPTSVTARGESFLQPGIHDVVFANLKFAGGQMAQVHLSWLNPNKERRLTVVGARKMVEFDDVATEKLRIYDRGYDRPPEFKDFAEYLTIRHGDIYLPHVPMSEPLHTEAGHFLDCIERGECPRSDMRNGLRVVRLLAAAQASLDRDGVPIALP